MKCVFCIFVALAAKATRPQSAPDRQGYDQIGHLVQSHEWLAPVRSASQEFYTQMPESPLHGTAQSSVAHRRLKIDPDRLQSVFKDLGRMFKFMRQGHSCLPLFE